MTVENAPPMQLHCRSFGQGARQILALHCTIAHSGAWRGLAKVMETEATFITPDMPSHGRSPDWDGTGDFPDLFAEALRPLLDRPMDVIGHSFGGMAALRLAVEQPQLVRSLTLIEPVFFAIAQQEAPELLERQARVNRPVSQALEAGDRALAARLFNRSWGDDATRWTDLSENARAAMARGIHILPASDSAIYADRPGLLKPGVLEALDMPVLLLRGGQSDEIIRVVNDGLARRIPGAENRVVDGAGHMLPITHPEATAAQLRAFYARQAG
jgi:lipase